MIEKLSNLIQSMKDNVARTKVQIAGGLLAVMLLMLALIPFAPDRQLMPEDALVTTQSFPDDSGTIQILDQQMDWQKHIMKLDIQVSDDIQMFNLKSMIYTKEQSDSTMQFIPTVDGKATIFIKNISDKFDTLSVAFQNDQQKNSDVNVDIYDDSQAAQAAKEAAAGATNTSQDSNVIYFFITQNSKYLKSASGKLKIQSQKDYAIDALEQEITFQNQQNQKMKEAVKKLAEIIKNDEQQIKVLKEQQTYQTGEALKNNQQQIQNLETDIGQSQDSTVTAKKNMEDIAQKIKKMNQQISDINSGKYKFPADEKSQKLG